jgi:hypothetical protein
MGAFSIFIVLLLLVVLLLFSVAVKAFLSFDTRSEAVSLVLLWLYPFIRITAEKKDSLPRLKVYIFNRLVYSKDIDMKGTDGKSIDMIKAASASDIRVGLDYGFDDPFSTAMACGSLGSVSELVKSAEIEHRPDFLPDGDFFRLEASAEINAGDTVLNYLKMKMSKKEE